MDRPLIVHVVEPDDAQSAELVAALTATRAAVLPPGPLRRTDRLRLSTARAVVAHGESTAGTARLIAAALHRPWIARDCRSTQGSAVRLTSGPADAGARRIAPAIRLQPPPTARDGVVHLDGDADALELEVPPQIVVASAGASSLDLLRAQERGCVVIALPGSDAQAVVAPGLPPAADDDAAQAIARDLVDDPDRLASLSRQARAHVVLHHELGSVAADLDTVLRAVAGGAPVPAIAQSRTTLPRVTVLMPTFRRKALLSRALAAIAAQTYPAELVQVVVVDNGSGDDSAEPARAIAEVVTLPENAYVPDARNAALGRADGEIVAFTDDDCRPEPTWLECLVAGFRDGVGLVQGQTRPDPAQPFPPLARSQSTPCEFGLYETANIAYSRAALGLDSGVPAFRSDLPAELTATFGDRFRRDPFGEDTDLGWRVRRGPFTTRFAVTATVHHEVFPPDLDYLLRRARVSAGFPLMVKRVPELRRTFLTGGVALGRHRIGIWLALLGTLHALITRRPRALALVLPWLWVRARPLSPGGRRARIKALPAYLKVDLVESAALAEGSVRARNVVL
ncbi:MAG TPA: glycosyltransferase [Mycobacteriales bacterium]|nr:glycosyltransferase [Mycobacteriales bacterium]